jgi:hypothetical protein
MDREARAVWRSITARFVPEFFCGAEFLLENYVEALVLLRDVVKRIKEAKASEPVDYRRLGTLMSLQRAEAAVVARLGSSLRISPKARFDRYSVRPTPGLKKPWELGRRRSSPRDDDKPEGGGSPSPFPAA